MTNTYRIVVRPDIRYALSAGISGPVERELTAEMLNAVAGVVVRDLSRTPRGHRVVDVQLERPSHEAALDEIVRALQQLGFSYVEATVSEWASNTVDGIVAGAGSGGLLGIPSKNPVVALIGALAGAVIGGLIGSEAREIVAQYQVRWTPRAGWVFTKVPHQQPTTQALRPAMA
jgi:hypothetical protein